MKRMGVYHPQGINQYVPGMQYVMDVVHRGIFECSLGVIPVYDQDGIDNDADGDGVANLTIWASSMDGAAGTETDALYGQTVVMKVSADPGAGGCIIDVYGEDYLGQPMVERLTTLNTATAEVEGVKAFKRVHRHVLADPAANNITFDLGWGHYYGVPYKIGTFLGGMEGTEPTGYVTAAETVAGVDAGAGTTAGSVTAPFDGYITGASYEVTTAQAAAAATLDAVVAGSGQATLDLVVPAVMAVGNGASNMLPKSGWLAVNRGDTITFTSDGTGDTGVVAVTVFFAQAQTTVIYPVTTDPATKLTGDPRGLIMPFTAADAVAEYTLRYIADNSVNASGNGGLHGIRHYIA